MQRRLVIVVSTVLLVAAALVGQAAGKSGGHEQRHGSAARQFVGYWMGIDPLDGGDSRRGITPNEDRTFSLIGRDTVFTLCDDTDRAIVTAGDLTVRGSRLVSDDFVISCTNTNSTVRLTGALRGDRQERHPRDADQPDGRAGGRDRLPQGQCALIADGSRCALRDCCRPESRRESAPPPAGVAARSTSVGVSTTASSSSAEPISPGGPVGW